MGLDIGYVEVGKEEATEYWDEYIVTISNENDVWCEPFKRVKGYINDESSVTYISNECNSAIMSHIKGSLVFAFEIDSHDEDSNLLNTSELESTHVSRDKAGNPSGFTKKWVTSENGASYYISYSHYSSDMESLKKTSNLFRVKL